MDTQNARIMKALDAGKRLTTMMIFRMGIAAPTKRISEIRAKGYPVKSYKRWAKNGGLHCVWYRG